MKKGSVGKIILGRQGLQPILVNPGTGGTNRCRVAAVYAVGERIILENG